MDNVGWRITEKYLETLVLGLAERSNTITSLVSDVRHKKGCRCSWSWYPEVITTFHDHLKVTDSLTLTSLHMVILPLKTKLSSKTTHLGYSSGKPSGRLFFFFALPD